MAILSLCVNLQALHSQSLMSEAQFRIRYNTYTTIRHFNIRTALLKMSWESRCDTVRFSRAVAVKSSFIHQQQQKTNSTMAAAY